MPAEADNARCCRDRHTQPRESLVSDVFVHEILELTAFLEPSRHPSRNDCGVWPSMLPN